MIAAARRVQRDGWSDAGRNTADAVASVHAVAIVSDDPAAAANVARGIGTMLAKRRRVIVADLVGRVPAIEELSSESSPEGVSDSFAYGVSLNKLTRNTPVSNLFVLPSGEDPVETEEIFRSGRWARLAQQCRASGGLLLVLVRPAAPGLCQLIEQLDGAIVVGRSSLGPAPPFPVIGRIPAPAGRKRSFFARPRWPFVAAGSLIALLALAGGFAAWEPWFMRRGSKAGEATPQVVAGSEAPGGVVAPSVANPGDSANAAAFAVEMLSANTRDGANLELERRRDSLPVATIAPVRVGEAGAVWFRVIVGAYVEPRQADSLLRATRLRGFLGDSAGALVRAPFALLLDSVASREATVETMQRHLERGVPVYALFQADGRVLVYAGAFATALDSEVLAEELRAGGLQPVLVYRTGRAF